MGLSLLHVAAWEGNHDAVAVLIEDGADVNIVDGAVNKQTPLVYLECMPCTSPYPMRRWKQLGVAGLKCANYC
jgi:hypothetical protein